MADYARQTGEVKISQNLTACGHHLLFRHYYQKDKIRLHAARFCRKHLLCPLCAIRRGAKQVQAYLARLQVIKAQHPRLRASLLTLTVKNGPNLAERFRHLQRSVQRLQQARRDYLKGRGPYVEFAKVLGAVGSYEFKRGKNSGEWHPHVHIVVLHSEDIDPFRLSTDWLKYTGDSFIVDCREFYQEDPTDGFLEVFKYAVKFSDLPLEDNWHGYQTLKGRRLVFSFGLFYGVEVPDELTDEGLDDEPFVELLYRFAKGVGYSLERVSEPRAPAPLPPARVSVSREGCRGGVRPVAIQRQPEPLGDRYRAVTSYLLVTSPPLRTLFFKPRTMPEPVKGEPEAAAERSRRRAPNG